MARTRTDIAWTITGEYKAFQNGIQYAGDVNSYAAYRNTCTDDVGFPTPHPLTIEKYEWLDLQRFNGDDFQGSYTFTADKYVPSRYRDATFGSITHEPVSGEPASAATLLYARSNPSRPVVDLPVFFAELRELPSIVKFAAEKGIVRKVAGGNLTYQFGIKPLVGDLRKLLDFNKHFERRSKELHRLHGRRGLRRRIEIWNGSVTKLYPAQVIDGPFLSKNVRADLSVQTKKEVWGTIRWLPTTLPPVSEDKYAELARKAVLGLTIDFNTAWQLMPWSWLIDWFSSSGDYIIANRNVVGAKAQEACVMTRTETVYTFKRIPGLMAWTGGDAIVRRTTKKRAVNVVPSIVADLPFMDGRKLSILGSLAVLRNRGYGKRN